MKKLFINLTLIGFLLSYGNFISALDSPKVSKNTQQILQPGDSGTELKLAALEILKAKCNVCHKKQNPFKIFSKKNMDKHAPKIYKQVFVYQRMPKGNEVKLTEEEYQTLKNWLKSKNIF